LKPRYFFIFHSSFFIC